MRWVSCVIASATPRFPRRSWPARSLRCGSSCIPGSTRQPKTESLGRALNADAWAVQLFSEGVARGQLVFVLSMLLHHLDPILRQRAHLGDWQVISPSQATGEVQVVESLRSIQGRPFDRPT